MLLLSLLLTAQAPDTTPTAAPPATVEELLGRVDSILRANQTPAAGLVLLQGDTVLWAGSLGVADVASGRAADATTLYRIGSTSKAFAAMAILRLVRAGKLTLDTPIRDVVPEVAHQNRWEATDPVRVVHLLEHTTGWDDFALKDYGNNDSTPLTLRQGIDYNPKPRVSRWRPGTRFAYNNAGPGVAAYIVEKLEGRPFEALAEEWFFTPIGMTTATYLRTDLVRARGATLYGDDGKTPNAYWHILMRPAGSINASPLDMAAYLRFLLGRGTVNGVEVLPAADLDRMEHPESWLGARAGLRIGYGLHLYATVDSGFTWYGHDGGVNGGLTDLAYLPGRGVGYAMMINTGNGKALDAAGRLVRRFLTRALPPEPVPPAVPVDPAVRQSHTGWFRADNPRRADTYFLEWPGVIRVRPLDTLLLLEPLVGAPDTLAAVAPRLFRPLHSGTAVLALTSDSGNGAPVSMQSAAFQASRHKVGALGALLPVALGVAWTLGMALTLLFALVWLPRWLFRRLKAVRHLRVRSLPLLATLTVVLVGALFVGGGHDPFGRLGHPTSWSVGIFLATLLYPLLAIGGTVSALRVPRAEIRPAIRWFGLVTSLLHLVAAVYLALFGVIGLRTWG